MDDPNITMEEYIRHEEEQAQRHGRTFNWQTATYGKMEYCEDEDDRFTNFETEYPAIVFDDTSDAALSYEPTVSPLNENNIKFRISFDKSDKEDYMVIFDENSFSYKIISVDNLKTDSENENDKINMPSFPSPESTISYIDDLDFFKDFENEFPAIAYNDDLKSISDPLIEHSVNMAPLPSKDQRHTWLRMSDTEMGLDVVDTLCFQFGGVRRRMTWRQFILALGLHTEEEMVEDGFRAYWPGSERTPKKVTCVDLFYLYSIDQGTANVMYLLAQYLFRHDEGRKSGARLSRVVTCGLPLIDLHKLGRLNIYVRVSDTSSWVAPGLERQPDVAVGAPGAIEDALAVDEGVRLIQHLWRHLSHRHLPPGLCSRGFTSSRMRMQYGVSLGLGYGVLTTCIDLAVKKSTIWYTLKKTCVELVRAF
ncbi:hypothetical protein Tco_0843314 [Tanacetum coccineum]|uniref:Uncharacterized protein n=1 Tax=Tanacetum coccineum TaxID=301880 RepID=A0ABQ5B3Y9_9ASTR